MKQVINNGRPLFSAYNPTGSSDYVLAVLIIGYLDTGEYIFYSPEDNCLKTQAGGLFDSNLTFELINPLN